VTNSYIAASLKSGKVTKCSASLVQVTGTTLVTRFPRAVDFNTEVSRGSDTTNTWLEAFHFTAHISTVFLIEWLLQLIEGVGRNDLCSLSVWAYSDFITDRIKYTNPKSVADIEGF
jgi:hypothetical protein